MRLIISITFFYFLSGEINSQGCCSGGSGSPIAGGSSQGVLQDRQFEIAPSFQHVNTNKFRVGDRDTATLFDSFKSNYLYLRLAYGLSKDFTMSVESGYFLNKTQIGLNHIDTISSSGIGDLILFPRYDILNRTTESKRTEITVGLGYKFPLGKYNDSTVVYTNPQSGQKFYTTLPPIIQPTNGSNDLIFYGFFYRGYPLKKFQIFANMLYVNKGWNPLGQKFGDYGSIGLFAGKTFAKKIGLMLSLKGEWIDQMDWDKNIDMLAFYNIDVDATGSRKVFFSPQVSYSYQGLMVYALSEIPLYQCMNNLQVASQFQITVGASFRFYTYKTGLLNGNQVSATYVCPMHPEETSTGRSKCKKCGMYLEKIK